MAQRIYFRGTPQQVAAILGRLPDVLAGKAADEGNVALSVRLSVGTALLSQVKQAFDVKMRGGIGSDGISWPPLKPETIARRRTSAAERKALGIRRGASRPSLSASEDLRWRALFFKFFTIGVNTGLSEREAKARAAALAWSMLKKQGAKTMLEKLGSRDVDILRDTGQLRRSISPGVNDLPSGVEGQIFVYDIPGTVIVGTNVKPWHHRGGGNLPARPLWPLDDKIPARWWPAIRRAASRGLKRAVIRMLGGP